LLARQLLLEPGRLPIPTALERVGALQMQYAPSGYVGLWSRLQRLERDALTRALERRSVIQATLMRNTIHLTSPRDYWPLVLAVRRERIAWSRRVQKTEPRTMARAAARLREFLAAGPRRQAEIVHALGTDVWRPGIAIWVDLVRVPPSGTWDRRGADLFALADMSARRPALSEEDALDHLVRRYLGAFGPARREEIANWAGMRIGAIAPALERLRLRRFRGEQGRELVDLPHARLPDPETPVPVRFLPTWDATLLVHAAGTGILPEEHRPRIFHVTTPHSFATFLVDGIVAGTWRYEAGRTHLEPFARLSRETRKELVEEAERLAAFHA
jgi:Winged helix DNA-binding domain